MIPRSTGSEQNLKPNKALREPIKYLNKQDCKTARRGSYHGTSFMSEEAPRRGRIYAGKHKHIGIPSHLLGPYPRSATCEVETELMAHMNE